VSLGHEAEGGAFSVSVRPYIDKAWHGVQVMLAAGSDYVLSPCHISPPFFFALNSCESN